MKQDFNLYSDVSGFVISIELVLVATIAIIGLITGFTAMRDAVISELSDVAGSVQDLNQGYTFNGVLGHSGNTSGSNYLDGRDWCDTAEDPINAVDNCITMNVRPSNER